MIRSWTELVPPPLPEQHFMLDAPGADLREVVGDLDLAPLLEVTREVSPRADLDFGLRRYWINPTRFDDFRCGRNCYTFYAVTVGAERAQLEQNYGGANDEYDRACMGLIRRAVEVLGPLRWLAYSMYTDSGECSAWRRGGVAIVDGALEFQADADGAP